MKEQEKRPYFFNLKEDKDTAIVRLLHSSVDTIETVNTHRIQIGEKVNRIKCLGDGCPLCANNNQIDKRIYIHLFDYTDNIEKVWDRTDKIIPQLKKLFESWNPLNSAVVKITRIGNEFPKYTVEPQNPMLYNNVDLSLIDKPVAKRFSLSRNADEIKVFLTTGSFPERKEYVPKDTYNKMSQQEKQDFKESGIIQQTGTVQNQDNAADDFDDLPF